MQLWIIGIICLAVVQIHVSAADVNQVESAFGSDAEFLSGFRSIGHQPNAAFGERIKNWFKRLKNRILGRKNEQSTPSPEDAARQMTMELDKEDLVYVQRHPRRFYVDLSKLSFDPKEDWGFRLGRWYFIRKVSVSTESDERLLSKPTYQNKPTVQEAKLDGDDRISHTFTSMKTTVAAASTVTKPLELTTFQNVTPGPSTKIPTTTMAASTMKESSEFTRFREITPADVTTKKSEPKDPETDNNIRDQSAEVIAPSD